MEVRCGSCLLDNANQVRNYGILIAFIIFFTFTYLFAAEYFSSEASKGEILVFRKGQGPQRKGASDEEAVSSDCQPPRATSDDTVNPPTEKPSSSSTFCWRNVCYDVKVKGETRRILSDVYGWVQPGKLTALMVSDRGRQEGLGPLSQVMKRVKKPSLKLGDS